MTQPPDDLWTLCTKRSWKFGPFRQSHVFHGDGSRFMSRWAIGRLWLHIFHRPDKDPWPHDHEWDFWTFPLQGYLEEVLVDGELKIQWVAPWRLHKRRAEHAHRVVLGNGKPVMTIVWKGKSRRRWGFWRRHEDGVYRWIHADALWAMPELTTT